MTIRIAATGVSHWHALEDASYLRQLARMEDVELVGIQDSDRAVAEKKAAEVGAPPVFTDDREMLIEQRPDFVIALGRPDEMAATAHHLLDTGLPFIMEKPMGLNGDEVRGIAAKSDAVGGFAAVPLFQRYAPHVAIAQKFIADGTLGPLSHISIRSNRPTSARYIEWDSPWMLDPEVAGGGCLRNLGAHGLDLFTLLTEEAAAVTGAQMSCRGLGQAVDDYAAVFLRSDSGVLGTVEVGNLFPFIGSATADGTRVGSDGGFKLSGRDGLLVSDDGGTRLITANGEERFDAKPKGPPPFLILRDTIERWQQGEPPVTSVHDCLRAQELIDQAYQMADIVS